ncbi:MAG: tetratricopeptide repeat protein [Betaproteobacteria bacterium]
MAGAALLVVNRRAASRPPAPLTGRDSIVVADFRNETGDRVFDGALRQAVSIELGQSPFFSIVSRERMRDALTRMTRSPDDRVAGELARDLCQRVGAKATVNGSIASLGRHYVIGLDALSCLSGETIATEQVEVSERERVLAALGSSVSTLRRRLGESLASIQRFDVSIEQATTPSLEALKAYSVGDDIFIRDPTDGRSIPFFERAIDLDPDFAMAHARLSTVQVVMGRKDEADRHLQAAYADHDRVTAPERFYIDARHCDAVHQPGFRAACGKKVYELWRRLYPGDWLPHADLAAVYLGEGQYENAIEDGLDAIRLNPNAGVAYSNLIDAYMALNRFEDAKRTTDVALARHLVEQFIHEQRFRLAFAAGDETAMAAERQAVAGQPVEALILADESDGAAFGGRLKEARLLRERATERVGPAMKMILAAQCAMFDAAVGAPVSFPAASGPFADVKLAVAALLSRDTGRAAALLRDSKFSPDILPIVASARALLAVEAGDHSAADRLADDASGTLDAVTRFIPPYLRGLAYLRARDGRHAAAEFQRIVDHRGVDPTSPFYPLAYVQRARASVLTNDLTRARNDYATFLRLWKDSDPDVPILRQARAEYATLAAPRD